MTRLERWALVLRREIKILLGRELRHRREVRCRESWHGSRYGGSVVCAAGLGRGSVVYAFGIGEDVSFERSLHAACGAQIHCFDPTPRALRWVARQELPMGIHVHPWGILDRDGTAVFFPPKQREHVSHTVLSPPEHGAAEPRPEDAIEVPVRRLATLRENLGHERLDLVKLDVEGAEYAVIADLARTPPPRPAQLVVEFHHGIYEIPPQRTRGAVERLRRLGYRLAAISPSGRQLTLLLDPAVEAAQRAPRYR